MIIIAVEDQRLICSVSCNVSEITNYVLILDFFIVGDE